LKYPVFNAFFDKFSIALFTEGSYLLVTHLTVLRPDMQAFFITP